MTTTIITTITGASLFLIGLALSVLALSVKPRLYESFTPGIFMMFIGVLLLMKVTGML